MAWVPSRSSQFCADHTQVSASRSCNTQWCGEAWEWAAGASILLLAVMLCVYTYETCVQAVKTPEQPTDGYGSCSVSEDEQLFNPRESQIHFEPGQSAGSLARQDLRSLMDGPDDSNTNLSPISGNSISRTRSPPTKAELDRQIYDRANRNSVSTCLEACLR